MVARWNNDATRFDFSGRAIIGMDPSLTQTIADQRQTLQLWLSWHEAQQKAASTMFQGDFSPAQVAEQLDALDQMRELAVRQSQRLLDQVPR